MDRMNKTSRIDYSPCDTCGAIARWTSYWANGHEYWECHCDNCYAESNGQYLSDVI